MIHPNFSLYLVYLKACSVSKLKNIFNQSFVPYGPKLLDVYATVLEVVVILTLVRFIHVCIHQIVYAHFQIPPTRSIVKPFLYYSFPYLTLL